MEPVMKVSTEGGMWVRQLHFASSGDVHRGHLHSHEHVTLLAHGKMGVRVDGTQTIFDAPHIITIAAMKAHDLEAMESGTVVYCVSPIADVVTTPI